MLRSLAPVVLVCLALVGWVAFRQSGIDPVREIDPSSTVQLAAARAGYPVVAPTGLPEGYRPTSARTDAGAAAAGDPVTLEIGYLTPSSEYAGFVVSDDARAEAVTDVLGGVDERGTVDLGGRSWRQGTTDRGETVLWRTADGVTVLVTGSAGDEELATMSTAVAPVAG